MKKNILIFTSSRADYNPLQNIITEFQKSKKFNSLIVATGQHNDQKSGNTIQEIRDNHKIKILKIKHPIGLRNAANISKSKSIIVEKISKILRKYKPQLLVLLGDRYELLPCAMTCVQYKVPVAHIHGGEVTLGSLDNTYRNAISKLSHIHFVCHNQYKKNLIKIGESPNRIFNYGAPSIENIKKKNKKLRFKKKTFLVTYHPNTIFPEKTEKEITQLLDSLTYFKNYNFILSQPNLDINSHQIIKVIKKYNKKKNIIIKKSMGKKNYFSTLQHINGIIGNSSSIILESSSFKLPAIMLGDRQKGRIMTKNIICANFEKKAIIKKIIKISNDNFKKKLSNIKNPFYKTNTSKRIVNKISSINLNNLIYEKQKIISYD